MLNDSGPMPKRVAILQSNYLPWKGYFDIIHDVDEFVFLDSAHYTRPDWRNRNRIKTARGAVWLTIPVGRRRDRLIHEVELPANGWARDHWRQIEATYARAPHFETYRSLFEEILLAGSWQFLSDLNQHLIRTIARELLGVRTQFRDSREFIIRGDRHERLLEILQQTGADAYVTGPAARSYIEPDRFAASGIELCWKEYGYPEYPQLYPPFVHEVTILDLLFHAGPRAPWYIWGWRSNPE
jgi:hypothetical protein